MLPLDRGRAITHAPKFRIYNNTLKTSYLRPIGPRWYTQVHWDDRQHVPHLLHGCATCRRNPTCYLVAYAPAILYLDGTQWTPVIWFSPETMVNLPAFRAGFEGHVFTVIRTEVRSAAFRVGICEDDNKHGARHAALRTPPFDPRAQMARIWRVLPDQLETVTWKPGDPFPTPQLGDPDTTSPDDGPADVLPFPGPIPAPSRPLILPPALPRKGGA
ncbi:MAG: hypothetical protein JWO38_4908 [Gemmataceae bacterium]|nr:hypothetical protein [Gemmataceae bacterium]